MPFHRSKEVGCSTCQSSLTEWARFLRIESENVHQSYWHASMGRFLVSRRSSALHGGPLSYDLPRCQRRLSAPSYYTDVLEVASDSRTRRAEHALTFGVLRWFASAKIFTKKRGSLPFQTLWFLAWFQC